MARAEVEDLSEKSEEQFDELVRLFAMQDKEASRNVIMEIRAGTGGEEAALFAADLFGMYRHYAENQGWKVEVMDASPSDMGGFREIIVSFIGHNVYQRLRYEGGGHRVQRVPETETQGRIHTSAVTVAVLPEAGGGRGRPQDGRRADGLLPRGRPRRPEGQQDLLGRAPHAHPHRHRGRHPGREEPAQEPRQGPSHPPQPPLRPLQDRWPTGSARARGRP